MNLLIPVLLFLNSVYLPFAAARELMDMNLEVATESKQEAFDQAIDEATHRLTEEILGSERTAKVWPTVRPRLLKNSTRYVQFIRGSTPNPGESKIKVQMRLSPDNLEALLREFGAVGTASVRLLPLIAVSEGRGSRYVWWTETGAAAKAPSLSEDVFRRLFQQLNTQFKSKNVYVLDPTSQSFRVGIPGNYRSEMLRREDQALLAQYLQADVVLSGKLEVVRDAGGAPRVDYDFVLWQSKSGRELAEIQRSEVAASDAPKMLSQSLDGANGKIMQELSGKLAEAMLAGSLNLRLVRVTVEGALDYKQSVELKKQLETVREIRVLRERLFEPSRVIYESESTVTGAELARALEKVKFAGFRVSLEGSQDDSLVLSVRPSAQ